MQEPSQCRDIDKLNGVVKIRSEKCKGCEYSIEADVNL